MKRKHLTTLKNVLDKCTTSSLPDDRIMPYILTMQEVNKHNEVQQSVMKDLQQKCGLIISESGQIDPKTPQTVVDTFLKLNNEYMEEDVKIDTIFNEEQFASFRKSNDLKGHELLISYENLLRRNETNAVKTDKSKENVKRN